MQIKDSNGSGSGDTARPGKPEALIRINYFSETFASINF